MRIRESEIFNEYAKLAQDRGLIKEAKLTKLAAAESVGESNDISAVQALYGVKPNGKEDDPSKDYTSSILDRAHPETAVVGRAYDAMNAVVENLNQCHNVMTYIADKDPLGQLTGRRYIAAYNDLTKTLVNVGFTMDNKGEEDLMKLADHCAGQLEKNAFWQYVAGAAGAAAVAYGIYYFLNAGDTVVNVASNSDRVLKEASGLDRGAKASVGDMIEQITALRDLASQFSEHQAAIYTAKNTGGQPPSETTAFLNSYRVKLDEVNKKIKGWAEALAKSVSTEHYDYDWWAAIMVAVHKITDAKKSTLSALGVEVGDSGEITITDSGLAGAIAKERAYNASAITEGVAMAKKSQPISETTTAPESGVASPKKEESGYKLPSFY